MLFNSSEYVWFLPLVFIAYWLIGARNIRMQNLFLLAASYLFYGWWDWRFLSLIVFSSVVDYFIGQAIHQNKHERRRKLLLYCSVAVNLGFLGFFKYCNFFIESFTELMNVMSIQVNPGTLEIVLPVGISFYTFQTMSYTIDVYRRKLEPTKDVIAFFAFISFFPQLVAGPIERATNLLPQFLRKRSFDVALAKDGMRQILWGLFKKVVIADGCAYYVGLIFGTDAMPVDYETLSGGVLLMGAVYFAFQIYGDFSGYSDIAIGTAKLFGFDLMRNFAYPYFSRDIAEFWRRWHISLSTWFRDYLYIPLGGSRGSRWKQVRNVLIIFIVSGFWHGSNWTFIVWGALNGLYFIPYLLTNSNRRNTDATISTSNFPHPKIILQIGFTFLLTCFAWIFFRAKTVTLAWEYIAEIFKTDFFPDNFYYFHPLMLAWLGLFILWEWLKRTHHHPLVFARTPAVLRWCIYLILFVAVLYNSNYHAPTEFIYFQF